MFSRRLVSKAAVAALGGLSFQRTLARNQGYQQISAVQLPDTIRCSTLLGKDIVAVGDVLGDITLHGTSPQTVLHQDEPVLVLATLDDGNFASSDRTRVNVWSDNKKTVTFGSYAEGAIDKMVGLPTGLLAISTRGSSYVDVWDAQTGQLRWALDSGGNEEKFIVALPHNRLASTTQSKLFLADTISIWDLETGACESAFPVGFTSSLAASPDGKLVTTLASRICVWEHGKRIGEAWMSYLPKNPSTGVTPDRKFITTMDHYRFMAVDLSTLQVEATKTPFYQGTVQCLQDGRVVIFSDTTMRFYES
jgi:WD40 repeat protein